MMKIFHTLADRYESSQYVRALISFLVIAAVFTYLLVVSWHKWGDLIVDTSRELWVPFLILQGKALYRDIYYFHGPLPVYLIALLYKILGASLDTLVLFGIFITAMMCVCLYKISRIFLNEAVSVIVVANFCFAFAFGVNHRLGIANYILPYSFASTVCMLFISAALYYFLKYIESEKTAHLIAWGVLLTASALARPETTLSVWVAFVVSGLVVRGKVAKARLLMLLLPVAMSTAGYCIILYYLQAFSGFKESLIGSIVYTLKGKDSIPILAAGFDDVSSNIIGIAKSLLFHLIVVAGIWGGSELINKSLVVSGSKLCRQIAGVAINVMSLSFAYWFLGKSDLQYNCIPILLLISVTLILIKIVRGKETKNDYKLFTVNIVSLIICYKIFLNATIFPYGFYLLNIGLIGYYLFFMNLISTVKIQYHSSSNRLSYYCLLLTFVLLFVTSWRASANIYANKSMKVDSGKGVVYCFNNELSNSYLNTLNYLKKFTRKDESLVVFPEGASLNFYSGRTNPLKYILFHRQDLEKIGEDELIHQLDINSVTYIVIFNVVIGGDLQLGVGYGMKLSSWMREHYEPVATFGTPPRAAILKKID